MPFKRKSKQHGAAGAPVAASSHGVPEVEVTTPKGTRNAGVNLLASIPAPPLDFRWVHKGSQLLQLPTVPITGESVYKPFSIDENARIEAAWDKLDNRSEIAYMWGREDGEWGERVKKKEWDLARQAEKERKKAESKDKKKDMKDSLDIDRGPLKPKAGGKKDMPRPLTPTPASSAPQSDADDGPEQPEPAKSELYKSIVEQAQNDPERFDAVKGVPVAQVGRRLLRFY
jgi:hypothetical protein